MPRFLALLAALIIVLAGAMTCLPLIREKAVQKRIQLELEEELRAQEALTREYSARIAAVKTDPAVVERLAREKFGLARPGEVVFKFRSDLAPPARPAPSRSRNGAARADAR